ncbi:MAG: GTPase Era [Rhodothermales bacterium]|nr:GTPase Era [Rhodothermales bacterium]
MTDPTTHRCGYAALLGRPNVGKSTLVNQLIGQKVSIVTRKPQTTRTRVLGILSDPGFQLILLDTPGVIKPNYGLQRSMMRTVTAAVRDADVVLFLADATFDTPDTLSLEYLGDKPVILVLNKMDRIPQEQALPLVEAYQGHREFVDIVPVSALKGHNIDTLLKVITKHLPLSPPMYPEEMISEHPERFFVAEIVREKIFERYRQEVPYATQVNIVDYTEREGEKDVIEAEIVVERDSQKGILIGKGGKALKAVGMAARVDIEEFLQRPVFLRLFVKVRDDWRNKDTFLKSYGYRD